MEPIRNHGDRFDGLDSWVIAINCKNRSLILGLPKELLSAPGKTCRDLETEGAAHRGDDEVREGQSN
jgi:hypothetical protein